MRPFTNVLRIHACIVFTTSGNSIGWETICNYVHSLSCCRLCHTIIRRLSFTTNEGLPMQPLANTTGIIFNLSVFPNSGERRTQHPSLDDLVTYAFLWLDFRLSRLGDMPVSSRLAIRYEPIPLSAMMLGTSIKWDVRTSALPAL